MSDLVLTGFMGTGKTTVGKILADRLHLEFVDTDAEIERRADVTIKEIFANQGEEVFRDLEHEVLRQLGTGGKRVIATGGGALLSDRNRSLLSGSQVMALVASPGVIEERIGGSNARPLLTDGRDLRRLLRQRSDQYERFPQVMTDGLSPEEVADEVARQAALPIARICFPGDTMSTVVLREDALSDLGALMQELSMTGRVHIITDENVESVGWKALVADSLRAKGFGVSASVLPPGEKWKSLETVDDLLADCVEAGLERSDTVLGLGGGVVGDVAGLVAALYMRGVRLVLAPTTLLAQIDAAIGGKTGVDAHGVKNLAGTFYPAELVVLDPGALSTLPAELLSDGLAEAVKIAVMRSKRLLRVLEELAGPEEVRSLPEVVWWAARLKTDVVRIDPREKGIRALLNFGHTVGHGLEAAADYSVRHGRCISAGMLAEATVAADCGETESSLPSRIAAILGGLNLPLSLPGVNPEAAVAAALHDKKRQNGTIRVAVPRRTGEGQVVTWEARQLREGILIGAGKVPA